MPVRYRPTGWGIGPAGAARAKKWRDLMTRLADVSIDARDEIGFPAGVPARPEAADVG